VNCWLGLVYGVFEAWLGWVCRVWDQQAYDAMTVACLAAVLLCGDLLLVGCRAGRLSAARHGPVTLVV